MEASAFEKELQKKTAFAEKVLREHLPEEEGPQKMIMEAMNYSLMAGGKRLRPILMWETYRMCGGEPGEAIGHFMAAIEMIHTYSLVHDDLPAMDNDSYRRGRETTWYVYGDAMGILAGDGLLNFAFETALKAMEYCVKDNDIANACISDADKLRQAERVWRALSVLAGKAGIHGMIGGQAADIMAEGRDEAAVRAAADKVHCPDAASGENLERLMFIHEHKTAALIQAAMTVGAILAGASEEQIRKIEKCAYNVGIAFQIQDDILDVVGDSKELGKPTGSDALNHKQTYVTLRGMEQAKTDVEALSREAADILDEFEGEHEFLKALILNLIYRRK